MGADTALALRRDGKRVRGCRRFVVERPRLGHCHEANITRRRVATMASLPSSAPAPARPMPALPRHRRVARPAPPTSAGPPARSPCSSASLARFHRVTRPKIPASTLPNRSGRRKVRTCRQHAPASAGSPWSRLFSNQVIYNYILCQSINHEQSLTRAKPEQSLTPAKPLNQEQSLTPAKPGQV
jgi:hypothetical protein